jgi:hypothetical protein
MHIPSNRTNQPPPSQPSSPQARSAASDERDEHRGVRATTWRRDARDNDLSTRALAADLPSASSPRRRQKRPPTSSQRGTGDLPAWELAAVSKTRRCPAEPACAPRRTTARRPPPLLSGGDRAGGASQNFWRRRTPWWTPLDPPAPPGIHLASGN